MKRNFVRYQRQQASQMPYRFEWNRRKATLNLRKHGVSFDEASTVFDDPLAAIFDDEAHSASEMRELIIDIRSPGGFCWLVSPNSLGIGYA